MKEPIKDFYNRIIGYQEVDSQGNKKVYDFYNRLLGHYEKSTNLTKDFYRRIVGKGDLTSALIYQENAKQEASRRR